MKRHKHSSINTRYCQACRRPLLGLEKLFGDFGYMVCIKHDKGSQRLFIYHEWTGVVMMDIEYPYHPYGCRLHKQVMEGLSMVLRKKSDAAKGARLEGRIDDAVAKKKWPTLFEYLTAVKDDAGNARETATVVFFMGDGVWSAQVRDRHSESVLWVSSSMLATLLDEIERALNEPNPTWREIRDNGKSGKKKN